MSYEHIIDKAVFYRNGKLNVSKTAKLFGLNAFMFRKWLKLTRPELCLAVNAREQPIETYGLTPQQIRRLQNAYGCQKSNCNAGRIGKDGQRIEMRMTFQEWFDVWVKSGKVLERGNRKGQYCMSRKNDIGHYEVGNVFIQLFDGNSRDGNLGKDVSDQARLKMKEVKQQIPKEVASQYARKGWETRRQKLSTLTPEERLAKKQAFSRAVSKGQNTQQAINLKRAANCKPCTIDGIKIHASLSDLVAELGRGKNGVRHPNFRYVEV